MVIAARRRKFSAAQKSLNLYQTLLMPRKLTWWSFSTCLIDPLVGEHDASVPLFDTMAIHAAAAAELALAAVELTNV
jgi:hypothetical protein